MSDAERAILNQAQRAMAGCIRRLESSQVKLEPLFPLDADRLTKLEPADEEALDAFLKRFEQLVTTIQDQMFRAIALTEAEDLRGMSRRDVAERMERIGALPSADQFRSLVALRNRLSHLYPDDSGRQAAILNDAYTASSTVLAAATRLQAHASARAGTTDRA